MRKVYDMILTFVLIITAAAGAILLVPEIFGYRIYSVVSGSMEPTLNVGSLVIIRKTCPSEIKTGDIITFTVSKQDSIKVTHRVVGIDLAKEAFITKGDANTSIDGPVKFENLVGKIVLGIPYLGFFAVFIKTKEGMLIVAVFLITILIVAIITDILKNYRLKTNKKNNEKGDI